VEKEEKRPLVRESKACVTEGVVFCNFFNSSCFKDVNEVILVFFFLLLHMIWIMDVPQFVFFFPFPPNETSPWQFFVEPVGVADR